MSNQVKTKEKLISFLDQFPEIKNGKLSAIAEMIPVIAPSKGTILVKKGQIPSECYFVLEGLVREYKYVEGVERTTAFYTEKNGSVSSDHYTNQTPSSTYLECVEDCLLIAGNMEIDEENYAKFPELMSITRKMLETELNDTKKALSNQIILSPKERYLYLLETRPDLLNRVPLHQIASYLGITAESLSRIRKRIVSFDE